MKLKVTKISVIKDGTRANLPCSEIVPELEKFRSEKKKEHEAEKILFCMEEIEDESEKE